MTNGELFTLELTASQRHIRIGTANPTVRTRKYEVVSCSVAVSKTFYLSQIVSTKRSNASGRKLKNSLQATTSVRCFCARLGKPRPPCASTIGFRRPDFKRQSKAASLAEIKFKPLSNYPPNMPFVFDLIGRYLRYTESTMDFLHDLRSRVIGQPEISTDGFHHFRFNPRRRSVH